MCYTIGGGQVGSGTAVVDCLLGFTVLCMHVVYVMYAMYVLYLHFFMCVCVYLLVRLFIN